jgi:AraC family transcriptional activator of pobA
VGFLQIFITARNRKRRFLFVGSIFPEVKPSPSLRKLHPLHSLGNAPVGSGGIRVERLEERLRPRVPFPHKHDFYHLLFIERGTGWHEIDFERFMVKKGLFFFVRPAEVHAWSLGKTTRGTVLEFTRASLPQGADNIFSALESLPSCGALSESAVALLGLMREEFREKATGHHLSLESMLRAFLVILSREGKSKHSRRTDALSEQMRNLVEKNFHREHSVEFYARELRLSPKALTTKVKAALGSSAGELIQERLLLEAKRLLAHSALTVAEVGYELGYEDPSYFARFFRKRAGLAPGKYRKLSSRTVHG